MANSTNKVWTPNEVQSKFIDFLKVNKGNAFTLAEISTALGMEIKSGSVNTLASHNLVKCNKNAREIVCACCGHKTKVSTWEIVGD